ncbi:MAG: histidine ammonia-lyase [Cyanothece sp. SIO1E1]|nr:histidine ammonia-lyase [Cyanothece sp. SIO1E1]
MNKQKFNYGVDQLSIGLALEIAEGSRTGTLNKEACEKIRQSRSWVDAVVSNEQVVYGVTTGFGPLCTTLVAKELTQELQHNLLKSHSVGVGKPIPEKVAKLMLILKAQALSQGYSGIRLQTLERILWHIDNDIIPFVPEKGSVGASGDLAPLSHLFLPLIGLGKVYHQGSYQPTGAVLQTHGLSPLQLEAKEGLALINGTQFMAAYGIVVAERLQRCLDQADITAAMMLEALTGSAKPFHADLHRLRPHPGCNYVAERLRQLLHGSAIMKSHENCERVQDPYSLRCIPQVHGASRQAWLHLKESIHTEINSVTDNPIILDDINIISGGNFHGQPIALPLDYAAMAAAEIGNIADRRIYLSIEGEMPGVPKLLMDEVGLNSGFMIPQYTTAALVSENKSLCFPASVDSVPTSLGQEDHVSMGSISGRKAYQVVENLEQILGIELLYAAQGLDFHRPLSSSALVDGCYRSVRSKIAHRTSDTLFEEELEIVIEMVREGQLQQLTDELAQQHQISFKNSTHELYGLY